MPVPFSRQNYVKLFQDNIRNITNNVCPNIAFKNDLRSLRKVLCFRNSASQNINVPNSKTSDKNKNMPVKVLNVAEKKKSKLL